MEVEIEEILMKLESRKSLCIRETYTLCDNPQTFHRTTGRVTAEWVLSYLKQLREEGEISILLPSGFVKQVVKLEVARGVEWGGEIVDTEPRRDTKLSQGNALPVMQQLSLF